MEQLDSLFRQFLGENYAALPLLVLAIFVGWLFNSVGRLKRRVENLERDAVRRRQENLTSFGPFGSRT